MKALRTGRSRLFVIGTLVLMVVLIGLTVYGRREASLLECNRINIPKETLPGLEGLRMLVISDIHDDDEQLAKAVDEGLKNEPDIAFILGDIIDATNRTSRTRRLIEPLKKLAGKVPVYACLGNHDMEKLDSALHIFTSAGIHVLRNETAIASCPRLGKNITIAGLGDWWEYDCFPEKCLEKTGEEPHTAAPVIVLSHNPAGRNEGRNFNWNLMLSGHTHGGQMRYPFTSKAVFHREGEEMTEGLHHPFPGKSIFVTRGISSALNLRFNCPTEFNILVVH